MEGWDQTLIPTNNSVIFVEKKNTTTIYIHKKAHPFFILYKNQKKKTQKYVKKIKIKFFSSQDNKHLFI